MSYLALHRTLVTDLTRVQIDLNDNWVQFDTKMGVYFFGGTPKLTPPPFSTFSVGRFAINFTFGTVWLWNGNGWILSQSGESWGPWTNIPLLAGYQAAAVVPQYRLSTQGNTFVNANPYASMELRGEVNYVAGGSTPLAFPSNLQYFATFNIGADTTRPRIFNLGVRDNIGVAPPVPLFHSATLVVNYLAPNTRFGIQAQSGGALAKFITLDGARWGNSNVR